MPVLYLDLFLLGYHHVIATYTRLGFDKKSLVENRVLMFYLPPVVLLSVVALATIGEVWIIATIYLHWQWYHYTRQSEGVAKSIKFKSKSREIGPDKFNRLVFYLIPTASFILMSSRQPQTFLFMEVFTLPVPVLLADLVLGFTFVMFTIWLARQVKGLNKGQVKKGHLAYLLSHHLVYLVAYVVIEDVTIGWLAINIWHNLQYISFVWHFNTNKFKTGFNKSQPIISWLSQPHRAAIYVGFCLIATFLFYSLVDLGISAIEPYTTLPLVVIAYQALNFHHYIADSVIWKLRKPEIHKNLQLQT